MSRLFDNYCSLHVVENKNISRKLEKDIIVIIMSFISYEYIWLYKRVCRNWNMILNDSTIDHLWPSPKNLIFVARSNLSVVPNQWLG
jgi:hypothetical protein